jgi:hypothetical protein
MQKTIAAVVAGGLLIAAAPALADDSSAALGAGGVVFTKNTPVRMAAEDLFISPKSVRIRFEFVNDTAKDVDTIVAFPLPDVDNNEFTESAMGTITADPVNFIDFKAVVDGKPVAFKVEQRAFYKGKDVTATLVAAGAPLNVVAADQYKKLDAITGAKRRALIKADLVDQDVDTLHPHWLLRTKFYWTQRFPAHKTVVIEHSYQPVTGQYFFSLMTEDEQGKSVMQPDYCIDGPTRAKIAAMSEARKRANGPNGEYLIAYDTDYILKTANNWNGPIGKFHLTLDKLKPENALSLCWDGELKKTGPTTFEATLANFAPARDIHLLVLE